MWLPSDRAAALEWQAEQDLICGGCGSPRDETMADEKLVEQGLAPDWVTETHRCRKCEALGAAQNAIKEADGDPGSGLYVIAREVRQNGVEVS